MSPSTFVFFPFLFRTGGDPGLEAGFGRPFRARGPSLSPGVWAARAGVRPGPAVAGSPDGLEGQARVAEAGRGAAFGRGWSGVSAGIGPPPRFGALARVGGRASRWRPWGLPAGRWAPERFPVAAGGPAGPGLPLLSPPCSSLFAACVAAGGSAWSVWMEGSSECIPRAVTSPGMNF